MQEITNDPAHPLLGPLYGRPPPGIMPDRGTSAIVGERCPKRQVEAALRSQRGNPVLMGRLREMTGLPPSVISASIAKLTKQGRAEKLSLPPPAHHLRKAYKWKPTT